MLNADWVFGFLDAAAARKLVLVTVEMVWAAVIWGLEFSYGLGKPEVSPLIRGILSAPGLEVISGALVACALEIYESQNVDFVDAYVAAVMERDQIDEVYPFVRKHISHLKPVRRKDS